MRRWLRAPETWAALLVGLVVAGLVTNWPWLRGPDEWRWNRFPLPGISGRLWLPALTLLVTAVAGHRWSERGGRDGGGRGWWPAAAWLVVASLVVQATLLYLEHPQPLVTLLYRTVSPTSGGFFNVAGGLGDMAALLRDYPARMGGFETIHPRTHPPGLLLLFWGGGRALAGWPALANELGRAIRGPLCAELGLMALPNATLASALVQMATPLWLALSLAPLYWLARQVAGERAARRAGLFFLLVPSLALWAARWNQLYVFLAALALCLAYRGLAGRDWRPLLLVGGLLSLATFLSLANLGLVALVGLLGAAFYLLRPAGGYLPLMARQAAALVAGLASLWLLYWLVAGVAPGALLARALAIHGEINRSYPLWLLYNPYDFFLFLGLPLVVALLVALGRAAPGAGLGSRPTAGGDASSRAGGPLARLWPVAFWATFVAIILSGATRGEVARLWMFLTPAALMAALPAIACWSSRRQAVMVTLQAAQLLALAYFVRPVVTGFPYYQPRPPLPAPSVTVRPLQASLGEEGQIELLGYSFDRETARPGETLAVRLIWRASRPLDAAYTVFVHLLDDSGRLVAQQDNMPRQGELPTTCWSPGELVEDGYHLALDPALPAGRYTVRAGLYRLDWLLAGNPDHRLPALQNGQAGDAVELGAVTIGN
jgi:hypothetical protein